MSFIYGLLAAGIWVWWAKAGGEHIPGAVVGGIAALIVSAVMTEGSLNKKEEAVQKMARRLEAIERQLR